MTGHPSISTGRTGKNYNVYCLVEPGVLSDTGEMQTFPFPYPFPENPDTQMQFPVPKYTLLQTQAQKNQRKTTPTPLPCMQHSPFQAMHPTQTPDPLDKDRLAQTQ